MAVSRTLPKSSAGQENPALFLCRAADRSAEPSTNSTDVVKLDVLHSKLGTIQQKLRRLEDLAQTLQRMQYSDAGDAGSRTAVPAENAHHGLYLVPKPIKSSVSA